MFEEREREKDFKELNHILTGMARLKSVGAGQWTGNASKH